MEATRRGSQTVRGAFLALAVVARAATASEPALKPLEQPLDLVATPRSAQDAVDPDDVGASFGRPPQAAARPLRSILKRRAEQPRPESDSGPGSIAPARRPATTQPSKAPSDPPGTPSTPTDVDRLEAAASEAKTVHAFSRVLELCDAIRSEADDADAQRLTRLVAWAHTQRGRLRDQAGHAAGALDDYSAAVAADPTSSSARHDLAITLAESGDYAAALVEFDAVVRAEPASDSALRNRAAARAATGDVAGALDDCVAARLLVAGGDGAAERSLVQLESQLLARVDRLAEAAGALDAAIARWPADAALLTERGHVLARLGKHPQAVADYRAACWVGPPSAETYRCLAWLLASTPDETLRDPTTALEAAWRARQLAPEDPLVLEASAAALAAAGRFDEASRLQQSAVARSSPDAAAGAAVRLALYSGGRPFVAPTAHAEPSRPAGR
ncbi:MAG: tetratricopeptide repeat protein [Lacipirellulaceae bacterium]